MAKKAVTEKGKPGRKPLSEAEKAARAKARAVEKEKAKNMKPVVRLQYQEADINMDDLMAAILADFKSENKRTLLTSLEVYLKPEDRTVYYFANGNFSGKVTF